MYEVNSQYADNIAFYETLSKALHSLIEGENNLIANLANISSWVFHAYPELNWCGFYLWSEEDQELVLGPFQGRPACIRIKASKGVCGAAYTQKKTQRVDDVFVFPGHIACDAQTESELVVPLIKDGKVWGVLDLDSPKKARFSKLAQEEFTKIMDEISQKIF